MRIIILLLIFLTTNLIAQEVEISTKITEVTLYKSGALVEREGKCNIQQGLNTITITGLPADLMEGSIIVKAPNGIDIISLDAEVAMTTPAEDDVVALEINNRKIELSDSVRLLEKKINTLQLEKQGLQVDGYVSNQSFTIANYKELITYKRDRIFKIDEDIIEYEKQGRLIKSNITKLENELRKNNAMATSEHYVAEVVVDVTSPGDETFIVQYFIEDAGWTPKYDVVVEAIDKPIELIYKAEVYQDSYEDWEGVNLVISSGQPRFGYSSPDLSAYLLYFDNYAYERNPTTSKQFKGSKVQGRVTDEYGEPLIGANVLALGTNVGTITDIDGGFLVTLPKGAQQLSVSYTGYDSKVVPIYAPYIDVRLSAGEMLDEVVVTGYSSKNKRSGAVATYDAESISIRGVASTLAGRVEGVNITSGVQRYNPTIEYNLAEKVTIEGMEDPKSIRLSSSILATELFYRAIPKVEESAYLYARVKDWQGLNLQDGSYSVLFEGKYLTNYALSLENIEKDLELSLGIDEDIRVQRKPVKDFTQKTFLSKNIKEKKTWEISVSNGKTVPIIIEVQDQYPISKDSDINIDIQEISGAIKNEEYGKLTWTIALKPKEKVEKILTYEVKYPRDRNLIVD